MSSSIIYEGVIDGIKKDRIKGGSRNVSDARDAIAVFDAGEITDSIIEGNYHIVTPRSLWRGINRHLGG